MMEDTDEKKHNQNQTSLSKNKPKKQTNKQTNKTKQKKTRFVFRFLCFIKELNCVGVLFNKYMSSFQEIDRVHLRCL